MKKFQRGYMRVSGYYGRFKGHAHNVEYKFHDLNIDDVDVAAGGTVIADSCNKIAQGTGESQRIGRKCTIKSIYWRYDVKKDNAASLGDDAEVVRVILYLDTQCNGATALSSQIIEDDEHHSFMNLSNKTRFKILMDRVYSLKFNAGAGNGTSNDGSSTIITGKFYKRCTIPLEFDFTAGLITEIRSNNLGVLLVARDGSKASFTSKMRLRFSDS